MLQFFVVVAVTLLIILALPDNIQLLNAYMMNTRPTLITISCSSNIPLLGKQQQRAFFDIITQSEYYYYYYSKNRIVLIK